MNTTAQVIGLEWILAVLLKYGPMIRLLAPSVKKLIEELKKIIDSLKMGTPYIPPTEAP